MCAKRVRREPAYDLERVKQLVREKKVIIASRPRSFIFNHLGRADIEAVIQELFDELVPEDFFKSIELDILPGVWGDVYRPVPFVEPESGESNDWYIKFCIEDEKVGVYVLSANYDGYIH